jgi:hypothetical protein
MMIWFFARGQESLRVESRVDNETGDYVATADYFDGRYDEMRFRTLEDITRWLQNTEARLLGERWTGNGLPLIPYRWAHRAVE